MLRALSTTGERGFTLIELLVVVLIVGVLAAVGVPLYLGYVRDARLAEAKAVAGSVLTAAQACAQTQPGTACTRANVIQRAGLTAAGLTQDSRWQVEDFTNFTLSATAPQIFSGGPIRVTGNAGNVANPVLRTGFFYVGGVLTVRCSTDGTTVLASETSGDPC